MLIKENLFCNLRFTIQSMHLVREFSFQFCLSYPVYDTLETFDFAMITCEMFICLFSKFGF